jgi:8-oxo-dGTP diphosphatase
VALGGAGLNVVVDTGAMSLTPMCLCYLTRTSDDGTAEVLLGVKKLGFGAGKIVGLGGHVDPGESPAQATVREVAEESSIHVDPAWLREMGEVTFRFPARPEWDSVVSVFSADRFEGEAVESDEIAPQWFPFEDLPLTKMWDDARLWLSRVLAGERVIAEITFDEDCETVAEARFESDAA